MSDVLSISEVSMKNDLLFMNIISNNLANVSTAGFKKDIAVSKPFELMMATQALQSGGVAGTPSDVEMAPGFERYVDQNQGVVRRTGNAFDIAIEGDGFFELLGPEGLRYSRHGAFTLDALGRLVDKNGWVVNGLEGDIRIASQNPVIDAGGVVTEQGEYQGQIKLVRFSNSDELLKLGAGQYVANGAVIQDELEAVTVRQGFLEESNVTSMDEMVKMISTLRHFEFTQKLMSGYDEMLGTAIDTIPEF